MGGPRDQRRERLRRRARRAGEAGFLLAAVLPFILFHRVIGLVAVHFRLDARYLLGWTPWALMLVGLAFGLPVVLSVGRDPEARFYPRSRGAYAGWGVTLYLLGVLLAVQVAELTAPVG
jgi:hypothetical protein